MLLFFVSFLSVSAALIAENAIPIIAAATKMYAVSFLIVFSFRLLLFVVLYIA